VSTFDNLKTGCKPDKHWILTTCQPILQKNSSVKKQNIPAVSRLYHILARVRLPEGIPAYGAQTLANSTDGNALIG
jgi:hypothetical protein